MKIIKLYSKYFFSVSNVVIIILITLFLICSYLVSILNVNETLSYESILCFYFENSIYYTKLIFVLLSSFLFMKLCNQKNEYVLNIVITAGYSKKSNYKFMIITNIIIITFVLLLSLFFYILIGYVSKRFFYLKLNYIIGFFNVLLIAIYYGLFSYLLCKLFRNQFVYLLLIILYFISELFVSVENAFKYIYLYFFPNINNSTGNLYVSWIYLILFIVLLYLINKSIYLNKDL